MFVGRNKGSRQNLWERGPNILAGATADDKIDDITKAVVVVGLKTILGRCKDFAPDVSNSSHA